MEAGGAVVGVNCITNVVDLEGREVGWAVVCSKLARIILIIVHCGGGLRQLHAEIVEKGIVLAMSEETGIVLVVSDETEAKQRGEVAGVHESNVGNIGWTAIFDGSGLYWLKDEGVGGCSSVDDLVSVRVVKA